jgi:hypothetical protein
MPQPKMVFRSVAFLLSLFAYTLASAQQPPHTQMPPTTSPLNAADQEQFVAYWTSETGWTSELQLRNNQTSQGLTVTPCLRLADGAETSLSPVTIKPQEVKSIDLDAAIAAAAAPQLVGAYGSVVLRYHSGSSANLYAAMMIRRTGHPVAFHIDASAESFQVGGREGVWWLPNDTASDYLILTNQGGNTIPISLSLYDAAGRESKQNLVLGPRETMRYGVRKLVQAAHLSSSYGGISISAASHAGSLDTLHFLFDEKAAFAAILKMFDHDENSKLEERDYAKTATWTLRAPMLALSTPDPALAFPPSTTLRPQLFIRNTTGKSIDAALRFGWRNDKQTGKATGPVLRLNPYETRRVDVAGLQNAGVLPKQANWTSVTITTNSKPDELMAVAASYDDSLRYGAQTPFSDQLSFRWEGGMWEYDPYHSSVITAGNGGTKPTEAAFTIFYNQGTRRYDVEQTLQPDEQMWIDVGKLIREHVPDKNGKTLPSDLTMGSYEFRDLTNKTTGTLFEGKVIYDKTYGHVSYGCAECCGFSHPTLFYDPLGIPLLGNSPNGVTMYDVCWDTYDDLSSNFYYNWSTGSTSIATADIYGTHTGHAVGATFSDTWGNVPSSVIRRCPLTRFNAPRGGDNVAAIPVNFRQTSASQVSPAKIQFNYVWSSSTGNLSDLANCNVREFVTYPGYVPGQQGRYYWTSPPYFNTFTDNPDTAGTPVSATVGSTGLVDTQGNVGFAKPYVADNVTSNQVFQFQCSNYQNNQWIQLFPQSGTIGKGRPERKWDLAVHSYKIRRVQFWDPTVRKESETPCAPSSFLASVAG